MGAVVYPAEWKGRTVDTIDLFLFLREQVQTGVILDRFMGSTHTHALRALIMRFLDRCAEFVALSKAKSS
jgi:hypothetical protein